MLASRYRTAFAIHLLFNPVSDDNAENVECEFDGNELTSRGVIGCFGRPYRRNSVQDTSADAIQDTGWTRLAGL